MSSAPHPSDECRATGVRPAAAGELFDVLPERTFFFRDDRVGLRAVLVIDATRRSPVGPVAVGGIRTRRYGSDTDQVADARMLAQAMSEKCALAALPVGGAKCVVRDHPDLERPAAFRRLGEFVEELGGLYRCAGDLGTTDDDLGQMDTAYVHRNTPALAASVGASWLACVAAAAEAKGRELRGLRVAIQGGGTIGAACARAALEAGMEVSLSELDPRVAALRREELGVSLLDPVAYFAADVDILAPCALGGVVDEEVAATTAAWALVGAANHVLSSPGVDAILFERGILHAPDVLGSAGAVIDGIGATVMGLDDRSPLIARVGEVAREVFRRSASERRPTSQIARALAAAAHPRPAVEKRQRAATRGS